MKNVLRLLVFSCLLLGAHSVSAQKFGIINSQELLALMPEIDSVQIKMRAFYEELQAQLETIQVEYNQKYEDYQAKHASMTEATRNLREKELQDLQNRFENYRVMSQQEAQQLNSKLMAPVIERAEAAISKVSKAGGYLVVFDDSVGSTVYHDKTLVVDLMPAVRKELGISETAKPAGAAAVPAAGAK